MTVLTPAAVSSGQFAYDPQTQTFSAEMSDLNGLGRVFDDAADLGFTIVSASTGRSVVFALKNQRRDAEGELLSEQYESIGQSGRPDGRFIATIYND